LDIMNSENIKFEDDDTKVHPTYPIQFFDTMCSQLLIVIGGYTG
jgi:hypothetical protein